MSSLYKRELRNLINNVPRPWEHFKLWMARLLTAIGGSKESKQIPSRLTKTRGMIDGYERAVREHPRQTGEDRAPEGCGQDPRKDADPRIKGRTNRKGIQRISKNRKEEVTMLKKGTSDKTRSENIAKEIRSGKKPAQAAAIAYSVQREAKKKAAKSKK